MKRGLPCLLMSMLAGVHCGMTQDVPKAPAPSPPAAAELATGRSEGQVPPSLQEVERRYLAGTMTARELQRHIARFHAERERQNAETQAATQEEALKVLRASQADPAKNPPPGPAIRAEQLPPLLPEEPLVVAPTEEDFADIEARMDALLREKQQRDSHLSNRVNAARETPAGAMTKRQRLDAILRLYIEGELSEEAYKQQRAAIIAEKE